MVILFVDLPTGQLLLDIAGYEDFDFGLYLTNMIEKKTFREYARAAAG